MKKIISLVLVTVMLMAFGAPIVNASQSDADDVHRVIEDLKNVKPQNSIQQKAYDKLETEAIKLEDQVRYNPDTIYDLDSIPARVMLLGKLGVAMRFATTELVNKVDAAHTKVASYIFGGLVYIANPFNRIEDLEEYGERFEALRAECLAMPDLGPDDAANLYKRAEVDELLHKARFMRFNELKDKDAETIKNLDKVIREVTLIRLKPQTTVQELSRAEYQLIIAIDEAEGSTAIRASKREINMLRKTVRDARKIIIKAAFTGQDVEDLKEVYRDAQKELLKIRPSAKAVKALNEALKDIILQPVVPGGDSVIVID